MNHTPAPIILIASDNHTDAELVQTLLLPEFNHVFITATDPKRAEADIDRLFPDILVLAFNSVAKCERHYQAYLERCEKLRNHSFRAIALCNKNEVQQAYSMCRFNKFDDYVLFWPMTLDAPRLLMSIHNSLRELTILRTSQPLIGERVILTRKLVERDDWLKQQSISGRQRIDEAKQAVDEAKQEIMTGLDKLMRQLSPISDSPPHQLNVDSEVWREFDHFKEATDRLLFEKLAASVRSLREWVDTLQISPIFSGRAGSGNETTSELPTILLVDDDEFQHKMVGKILTSQHYRVMFALSGVEALALLQKARPDLILMDVMMPQMNGIDTLKAIKSNPDLSDVPVVMLTGHSEGPVVLDCLRSGARDFVVKPFDSNTLISKVSGLV